MIETIDTKRTAKKASFEKLHQSLSETILKRITVSTHLDKLGFIGMINRTNTGALTTTIGKAPTEKPVVRHIQPIKAIARKLAQEREGIKPSTQLEFLRETVHIGEGVQLIKETIGPDLKNPAEWMDGLSLLLEAGVPVEKIFFIPTVRDPIDTLSSWMRMWKWDLENFPFKAFNLSFNKTLEAVQKAESLGILVVPYVHEFLRDFGSKKILARLMLACDLPFTLSMVEWDKNEDAYWQGQIVKYDVPPTEFIHGVLSKKHGGRGGLIWLPPEIILSNEQEIFVREKIKPAFEIYDFLTKFSKKQLRIK
ncbi:hypothetical protein A2313_01515 [Candidatus Roizmanbacteria bacterium RIFOXYB2_FULL_41_10]|uniref:Uncharacterized protein n=1 Tax=Candidatus Roizmanbacteria bacterium RIFOXYA1_FULL_41_12 TaxID=1802082 RepID=A0A1F7KGJ6_9BACT|nr:MAG: hypothetical protein A2209_02950 [Candidatus Roizmanbacteria bacterium RIFOXYA1_FULL_41_12]OGK71047.1 MAG: hypothetical protein A2313_01515 [Candidatus Roizmanbacteria bacterium RIFOXYB2_FULL_41_10]OGK72934.1 MAG: hypothetical protein A2459_00235 [Candidatus Roizmanbacteria bacterium RIFOXYC2_FULL_41_10]OGK74989.1 MAG: hypothetical protein A2575_03635 [Candidatus Roizmanbacteria bacterium RIFOXYD1_FULL_41_24]